MAFQLSQGLFSLEFTDFHAVIGASVDASGDEIRLRYLQVAKRLHPDSLASVSPEDRQIAGEILSKLVNPAYKKLSKEKDLVEYQLLLKLKGKEALRIGVPILKSAKAIELQNTKNWSKFYETVLQELISQQYTNLRESLNLMGEISELNLVYLVRRESSAPEDTTAGFRSSRNQYAQSASVAQSISASSSTPTLNQNPVESDQSIPNTAGRVAAEESSRQTSTPLSIFIDAYCRRAEDLMAKNQFSAAIKELRDALKDDPTNSRCHALMGRVYLLQKQLTMARISFDQALKSDPSNEAALQGKQAIEKLNKGKSGKPANSPHVEEKSGGLFGSLFGGRKK